MTRGRTDRWETRRPTRAPGSRATGEAWPGEASRAAALDPGSRPRSPPGANPSPHTRSAGASHQAPRRQSGAPTGMVPRPGRTGRLRTGTCPHGVAPDGPRNLWLAGPCADEMPVGATGFEPNPHPSLPGGNSISAVESVGPTHRRAPHPARIRNRRGASQACSCQTAKDGTDQCGMGFLARSKRGTRSMPAWVSGRTRHRRRQFCASGWEETKEGAAVWWLSPDDRNWL
jgi:hypothetical protein